MSVGISQEPSLISGSERDNKWRGWKSYQQLDFNALQIQRESVQHVLSIIKELGSSGKVIPVSELIRWSSVSPHWIGAEERPQPAADPGHRQALSRIMLNGRMESAGITTNHIQQRLERLPRKVDQRYLVSQRKILRRRAESLGRELIQNLA